MTFTFTSESTMLQRDFPLAHMLRPFHQFHSSQNSGEIIKHTIPASPNKIGVLSTASTIGSLEIQKIFKLAEGEVVEIQAGNNNIQRHGAEALAETLKENKTLQGLDVRFNVPWYCNGCSRHEET